MRVRRLEAIARELNLNLVKIIVHCSCPKLISSGRRSASEKPSTFSLPTDFSLRLKMHRFRTL